MRRWPDAALACSGRHVVERRVAQWRPRLPVIHHTAADNISSHYDQHEQVWRETAFNHNEIVTRRGNCVAPPHGAVRGFERFQITYARKTDSTKRRLYPQLLRRHPDIGPRHPRKQTAGKEPSAGCAIHAALAQIKIGR